MENQPHHLKPQGTLSLKIINNLEVNEEILYGRMTELEQSTLVSQKLMKIQ
jgi:hypothetical protein